jgi:hypothetical protein
LLLVLVESPAANRARTVQNLPKHERTISPACIRFYAKVSLCSSTVDDGKLSGYVSRFGDSDSDKGQFIEQFFDKTSLQGDHLSFTTKTIHGMWYDFSGTITITSGRKPPEEGYRVIKGTLIQHTSDDKGAEKAMQRQVEFKSFPADLSKP